jgi:LPS sulfotransferase NodH
MSEAVLIFGAARTGSSFVVNTLRGHSDLLVHGEPFQTEHLEWHVHPLVLPMVDLSFRERSPYQFIRWIYRQSFGRRYVILKILFGQKDEILWRLLRETDIRAVFLRRSNRLAHFASICLAYQTNVWNANLGEAVDQNAQIHFDPAEFTKFLKWQNNCERAVENIVGETGRTLFECNYHPSRMGANVWNILKWLGIDKSGIVESSLVRMRDNRIMDRFSNPGTVENVLSQMDRLDWMDE